MRLSKEEYREAKKCLKRYNYNYIEIMNIRADIMSIGSANSDGMPKAPYNTSDKVLESVIRLQEDADLQEAIKEYKAVAQALQLVDSTAKKIFEEEFQKRRRKQMEYNRQITY